MLIQVADAPEYDEEAARVFAEGWPEFIFHDALAKQYAERRDRYFAEWNFYFVSPERGLLAGCWGVSLAWDGSVSDLPGGYSDAVARSVTSYEQGVEHLRTHVRLGATILAPAPASQTITGSVADWEKWTDMAFPSDGTYTIPAGLSTLTITNGVGTYTEPNIWVRHA